MKTAEKQKIKTTISELVEANNDSASDALSIAVERMLKAEFLLKQHTIDSVLCNKISDDKIEFKDIRKLPKDEKRECLFVELHNNAKRATVIDWVIETPQDLQLEEEYGYNHYLVLPDYQEVYAKYKKKMNNLK